MMNSQRRTSLVWLLSVLLLGCSSVQSEWDDARRADTSASYRAFLARNGASEFAAQAREAIERLDANEARAKGTADAWQSFLKRHPKSAAADEARREIERLALAQAAAAPPAQRAVKLQAFRKQYPQSTLVAALDDADWEAARADGSANGCQTYLACHPEGRNIARAEARLMELAWADARRGDTADGYEAFLKRYEGGAAASSELVARARAAAAWAKARATNTEAAYTQFLSAHGDSEHAAAAGNARQAAAWRAVESAWNACAVLPEPRRTTVAEVQARLVAFVDRYPQAAEVPKAREHIDAADWKLASLDDDLSSYQRYIDAHPSGAHVADARARTQALSAAYAAVEEPWNQAMATGSVAGFDAFLAAHPDGPAAARARVAKGQVLLQALGYSPGPVDGRTTDAFLSAVEEFRTRHCAPPPWGRALLANLWQANTVLEITPTGKSEPEKVETLCNYWLGVTKVGGFVYAIGGARRAISEKQVADVTKYLRKAIAQITPGHRISFSLKEGESGLVTPPVETPAQEDAEILETKLYAMQFNTPNIIGFAGKSSGNMVRVWEEEPGFLNEVAADGKSVQVAVQMIPGLAEQGYVVHRFTLENAAIVDGKGQPVAWPVPVWHKNERVWIDGKEDRCTRLRLLR